MDFLRLVGRARLDEYDLRRRILESRDASTQPAEPAPTIT
jgi:hypothetical protein